MDYRDTINLPFTELAMKAGLAKKEPEILKFWNEINLYGEIRTVSYTHLTLPTILLV